MQLTFINNKYIANVSSVNSELTTYAAWDTGAACTALTTKNTKYYIIIA